MDHPAQMTTRHPSRRVVVIDDDPEVRALHRRVLEPLGLEVVVTTNAGDGIDAVAALDPLVTVLDVTMPGMDGFAAARRIRELSDTYLVMVTALTDEIDVVTGLGAGADDYVSKPYRPRELRARVEALLRRPRAISASTEVAAPHVLPQAPEPEREPGLWTAGAPMSGRRHADVLSHEPRGESRPRVVPAWSGSSALAVVAAPAPADPPAEPAGDPAADPAVAVQPVRHLPAGPSPEEPELGPEGWRHHGTLSLHVASRTAVADGTTVELDAAEAVLLDSLMETGTRVRSVAHLVLALRGEGYVTTYFVNDADRRSVVDHMESLRRRLGDTGPTPAWVEPVRTVGYRMTPG